MNLITLSIKLVRQEASNRRRETITWYKRYTQRHHRRAVRQYLKTGQPVRNLHRRLTNWHLD